MMLPSRHLLSCKLTTPFNRLFSPLYFIPLTPLVLLLFCLYFSLFRFSFISLVSLLVPLYFRFLFSLSLFLCLPLPFHFPFASTLLFLFLTFFLNSFFILHSSCVSPFIFFSHLLSHFLLTLLSRSFLLCVPFFLVYFLSHLLP